MAEGRRIKILRMNGIALASFFGKGQRHFYEVKNGGLPLDVTITHAEFDHRNGELVIHLHSSEFEPVPEGSHFEQIRPSFGYWTVPGTSELYTATIR